MHTLASINISVDDDYVANYLIIKLFNENYLNFFFF